MRLLFKHLWRTFKRAPWQPLLIILTVILSVTTGIVAFRLSEVFFVRGESMSAEDVALGDITLTASSDRAVGILFADDAEKAVGERGRVFGDMLLVGRTRTADEDSLIAVSAGDFKAADRYFNFKYYEYGSFRSDNIDACAIVSKSFSEKGSISVGDCIDIELLGETLSLNVEAVVENEGLFSDADIMISIGRIQRILAEKSDFIASLGDSFAPCNRILIKCNGEDDINDLSNSLRQHDIFKDCIIEDVGNRGENTSAIFQTVSVLFLMFLLLVLACILIMTSYSLMRRQRTLEYAQFGAIGASRTWLLFLGLWENILYASVGSVIGISLSPYALGYAIGLFDWNRYSVSVGWGGIAFGAALAILLSVSGTLIAAAKERKKDTSLMIAEADHPVSMPSVKREILIVGIPALVCTVTALIIPVKDRLLPAVFAIVFIVFLTYYLFLPLLRGAVSILENLCNVKNATLRTALKLTQNDYGLCHVGRLVCVLCTLLVSIWVCSGVLVGQQKMISEMTDGDIITLNMSDELAKELLDSHKVEQIVKFGIDTNAQIEGEYSAVAVCISCEGKRQDMTDIMPEMLPKGDEAVISEGLASLIGAEIGDNIILNMNGVDYSCVIKDTKRIAMGIVYVDAEYVSNRGVMHSIKLDDGYAESDGYWSVASMLEAEGVMLTDPYEINSRIFETISGFISLIKITVAIALIISAVGCANMFVSGHRDGLHNRELLAICGADRRMLRTIYSIRIILVLSLAIIVGCAVGLLSVVLMDAGVRSFGFMMV